MEEVVKPEGQAPEPSVRVYASTHPGRVRERNEDAIGCSGWAAQGTVELASHSYSWEASVVCVVADGLGGQPAGDIASITVTRELVHNPPPRDTGELGDALLAAHDVLARESAADPSLAGMATTIAILVIAPDAILCANVGDTRIYEVVDGSVLPVSFDDNPSAADSASAGPQTSVLTQALGGNRPTKPSPHVQWFRREPLGFLLCSDGLTNTVSDDEIAVAFSGNDSGDAIVGSLVRLALERGAPDNVSVMLVRT
jgi:serine/threonine protein phosphatase PrpC